MKKFILIILIIIFLFFTMFFCYKTTSPNNITKNVKTEKVDKTSVSYNGWLHTNGYKLENEKNEPIQLRGLSSHGIEWFSDVVTYDNLKYLKNNWNTNVFRIAMYTDSNSEGYIFNKEETKQKVYNIVDIAIQLDMYVIIDWHILTDNNPQDYKEEAKIFFDDISKKYANNANIIYEICNEPNGNEVTWEKHIKPYANEIIPIIRKNSEKSLILVGTPDWCKKLNKAADEPLEFSNIAYTCHFYSGTHGSELREKIDYCIEKNIPIFVSECGLTEAHGDGEVYFEKFNEWINYLNSKNISWVYWSFSNKDESSAILLPSFQNDSEFENLNNFYNNSSFRYNKFFSYLNLIKENKYIENHLTNSGNFIKNIFQLYE